MGERPQDDRSRLKGRQARKGSLSDGGAAPVIDVKVSADPTECTPGWFVDSAGLLRNWKDRLDALVTAIQAIATYVQRGHYITHTVSDTSVIDHANATLDLYGIHAAGSIVITCSAITGTSFTAQLQYSDDGTTWTNGATAAVVVNGVATFTRTINANDLTYRYIRMYYTDTIPDVTVYTATETLFCKGS